MYYNSTTREWLVFDPSKNEYVPYVAPTVAADATSTAGQAAIEQTNAAVEAVKVAANNKPVKRSNAVIGAKAKLNPQNVAANVKAEEACTSGSMGHPLCVCVRLTGGEVIGRFAQAAAEREGAESSWGREASGQFCQSHSCSEEERQSHDRIAEERDRDGGATCQRRHSRR